VHQLYLSMRKGTASRELAFAVYLPVATQLELAVVPFEGGFANLLPCRALTPTHANDHDRFSDDDFSATVTEPSIGLGDVSEVLSSIAEA